MAHIDLDSLNSMQYDVLKEIGNIGAGNATTALSQMVGAKIDMSVPIAELLDFKALSDIVGGAESLVVGILLTLEGDIDGMILFVLDWRSAHSLVNLLMQRPLDAVVELTDFSEIELSALNEIGNIIAGAYLSSLSSLTNLKIVSSVPYMAIDMAGAILSVPAIEFGKLGDKALLIQSQFGEDNIDVNGYFILIPTLESYGTIMTSLGL